MLKNGEIFSKKKIILPIHTEFKKRFEIIKCKSSYLTTAKYYLDLILTGPPSKESHINFDK